VEGLLNLCMAREAQIAELHTEIERLKKQIMAGKQALAKPKPGIKSDETTETDSKSRGILVVEDSEVMRRQLVGLFMSHGYEVIASASNGSEALQIFKSKNPAIVTMDLKMPVMDGYEATREMKKINPNVKVIIISQVIEKDMILQALKAGASEFVAKPVQPERLIQLVDRLLKT
ncbi:MAG TPA: response regulator, partial [Firmicutes bacterium]|nr:response regulator [Bacillota bacterium]